MGVTSASGSSDVAGAAPDVGVGAPSTAASAVPSATPSATAEGGGGGGGSGLVLSLSGGRRPRVTMAMILWAENERGQGSRRNQRDQSIMARAYTSQWLALKNSASVSLLINT